MAVNETESAAGFQFDVTFLQWRMVNLNFTATLAADHVMVSLASNLVDQVSTAHVSRASQSVFGQEFERAVDGSLRQTGEVFFNAGKYLDRGEMRALVVEHMQNRHPLGCHTKSARA